MVTIGFVTMLMASLSGCGAKKNLEAGSTWETTETTKLTELTIADDAVIKAPEGYSVTMTVDSALKSVQPGSYKGNLVLAVIKA